MKDTVLKYIEILLLTETKLDEVFLISQFLTDGFSTIQISKPYRFDRKKHGRGVIVYVRDTIPSKIFEKRSCQTILNVFFMELSFIKCKWLLCGTYHPPSQDDEYYFNYLNKALDTYSNYEKVLLVGVSTQITPLHRIFPLRT